MIDGEVNELDLVQIVCVSVMYEAAHGEVARSAGWEQGNGHGKHVLSGASGVAQGLP